MAKIATFDSINKPLISIKFTGCNVTQDGFTEFINNWNQCDEDKSEYNFFFDVSKGIGFPNIRYVIGIAGFIMRKKKEPKIYLKHSIIYITSSSSRTLLRLVFNLSSPIAPVYIISSLDGIEIINTYIETYIDQHNTYPKTIPYNDVLVFMP